MYLAERAGLSFSQRNHLFSRDSHPRVLAMPLPTQALAGFVAPCKEKKQSRRFALMVVWRSMEYVFLGLSELQGCGIENVQAVTILGDTAVMERSGSARSERAMPFQDAFGLANFYRV